MIDKINFKTIAIFNKLIPLNLAKKSFKKIIVKKGVENKLSERPVEKC